MFKMISLIEYWVYCFCSVCFCVLVNDFITIWLGADFVLSSSILYICVFNFYLKGVLYPIWCFRNTTGLFKDTKYMMFIAAAINLVFSVVLGQIFGILGILAATAIARISTNIWYEPRILFARYFREDVKKYYIREVLRFVQLAFIIGVSVNLLDLFLPADNVWARFFCKLVYCVAVPNIVLWLENHKTQEFIHIKNRVISLISNKCK